MEINLCLPVKKHVAIRIAEVVVSVEDGGKNVKQAETKNTTKSNSSTRVSHDILSLQDIPHLFFDRLILMMMGIGSKINIISLAILQAVAVIICE